MRRIRLLCLAAVSLSAPGGAAARPAEPAAGYESSSPSPEAIDRDLLEVTIPRLHELYAAHKYTVTHDALKGKRFGVPAFILHGAGVPFQGLESLVPESVVAEEEVKARVPLRPDTREAFDKALEGLRAAGATVVFDDSILPETFAEIVSRVGTLPYVREGTETFLEEFGPEQYHSPAEYEKAVGSALPATLIGGIGLTQRKDKTPVVQTVLKTDPNAEANYLGPRRRALEAYNEVLDRLRLDGLVYPATQMPPPDETMAQDGRLSEGPHSDTGWANMIGVPAVVVLPDAR